MIPNLWYAIAESSEVGLNKPVAMKRAGEDLVFWRGSGSQLAVMRDRCPHRSASLSLGKVVEGNIQCPFHGFRFDTCGALTLAPANGRNGPKPAIFRCGVKVAREAHGFIWLWNGEPQAEYPPLPWFDNLEGFTWSTCKVPWQTDHTRAIEGMLDVSHLPFVHARTIGRGNRTLVNGPYTTLEDNKIRVWVTNQPDAGLPAAKPTELPPPNTPPGLMFNFPNVWQLVLGDKFRIALAAAPIDDENVMLYVRTCQGFTKNKLLGKLITRFSGRLNGRILREDQFVVGSQRPKKSGLDIGEQFIPADRPIALYLRHRRDLIRRHQDGQRIPEIAR